MRRRDVLASLEIHLLCAVLVTAPLAWYRGDGAPVLRTASAVFAVTVAGALIWASLRRAPSVHRLELLGAGAVVGLSLLAAGALLLRPFTPTGWGGPLGLGLCTIVALAGVGRSQSLPRVASSGGVDAARLGTCVVVGLFPSRLELWPAVAMLGVGGALVFALRRPSPWLTALSRHADRTWRCGGASLLVGLGYLATLWSLTPGDRGSLFGFGTESIPRIAWGNSVLGWGPNENIALAGHPLRYHWFTHLAQAALRQVAGTSPEALVFAGVWGSLDVVAMGTLIWAISRSASARRGVAEGAVLIAAVAIAPKEPYRILTDSTPDATSWLGWMLLASLAIILVARRELRLALVVVPGLVIATMLGNGPYGIALIGGLGAQVIVVVTGDLRRVGRPVLRDVRILLFVIAGIAGVWAYVGWLTPSPESTTVIEISTRFILTWQGFSTVAVLWGCRVLGPVLLASSIPRDVRSFVLGVACVAPLAFVIFRNSTGNMAPQFIMPALALSAVPAAQMFVEHGRRLIVVLIGAAVVGIITLPAFVAVQYHQYARFGALDASERLPGIVAVAATAMFACSLAVDARARTARDLRRSMAVPVLAAIGIMLGLGSSYAVRGEVRRVVDRHIGRDVGVGADPLISKDRSDAFGWIRAHVPRDAVLATNLICGREWTDFFACPSAPDSTRNSYLAIAAMAERRVVIEGDAWAHVGLLYTDRHRVPRRDADGRPAWVVEPVAPRWLRIRIDESRRIATSRTAEALAALAPINVRWFVGTVPPEGADVIGPSAGIVRYRNAEIVVVELAGAER